MHASLSALALVCGGHREDAFHVVAAAIVADPANMEVHVIVSLRVPPETPMEDPEASTSWSSCGTW